MTKPTPQTPQPGAQAPRPGRGLKIALVCSLAVNLLIVGGLTGLALSGGPDRRSGPTRDVVLPYARALSSEDRRALRQSFQRNEGGGSGRTGAIMDSYQEALHLLRRDPFDAQAFDAVMRQQGQSAQRRQAQGRQLLTQHLSTLPEAERRAYADRLEAEIEGFFRSGGGNRPPRGN